MDLFAALDDAQSEDEPRGMWYIGQRVVSWLGKEA